MLVEKSMRQSHPQYKKRIVLFFLLPCLSLLTSCATTFIPGLDRILFPNSSAKVGPLVTSDEQYPATDEKEISTTSPNESSREPAEPTSDSTAPVSEPQTQKKPDAGSDSAGIQSQTMENATPNDDKPELPEKMPLEPVQKKEIKEIAIDYGSVAGKVILVGEKGQQLPAIGTMITLTPQGMTDELKERPSQVHIIDMEDKTYKPRYSTIHAGDQVVFVNKDNIRHNVFSSSGNNAFDLGTYGAGLKRAVTLEEPGIVKIYCNIHSEMATFIAVGNQGLSVRADDQGRFKIDEVLPGNYEVTIWNIRGESKRTVEVKAKETANLIDRIDTTAIKIEPHKNKFGGNYSKNSAMFEDEFY
jgi:plastocyanin